jgi:uncharacterized protein YcbK (DUF882 family)
MKVNQEQLKEIIKHLDTQGLNLLKEQIDIRKKEIEEEWHARATQTALDYFEQQTIKRKQQILTDKELQKCISEDAKIYEKFFHLYNNLGKYDDVVLCKEYRKIQKELNHFIF